MLPEHRIDLPGPRIETEYRPAPEVGGDFFQIAPHAADGMRIVRDVRPRSCLNCGYKAGANISPVCDAIQARPGELGMRRIQGVLKMVKQYGSAASDNACAMALELRFPSYYFVRRYLERSPQAYGRF